MKIILLKDVRKLGQAGVVVEVSDGFARNYLLPNKLGQPATPEALERSKSLQTWREQRETHSPETMTRLLQKLQSAVLEFSLPGDKAGHLYSGLKESEILAKISGGDSAARNSLKLVGYTPLKQAGRHTIALQGPQKQTVKLTVSITCQN